MNVFEVAKCIEALKERQIAMTKYVMFQCNNINSSIRGNTIDEDGAIDNARKLISRLNSLKLIKTELYALEQKLEGELE